MHDQLGGGFHRYSVDESWFVPHFEKMLYDQAQLVISYLEAFQITQEETLAKAARRTLDYVMRDMTAPEGGFYSAEDADSVASRYGEMRPTPAKRAKARSISGRCRRLWISSARSAQFDLPKRTEWNPTAMFRTIRIMSSPGRTSCSRRRPFEDSGAEKILFEARAKRPRPHLDDKILTAWNGLMISAFAKGAAISGFGKIRAGRASAPRTSCCRPSAARMERCCAATAPATPRSQACSTTTRSSPRD